VKRARAALGRYRRGVGVMLLDREGRVFVGQRVDSVEDAWQMPQGGIAPGEAPREAAFRELKEEVGVEAARVLAESRRWLSYDLPPDLRARVWGGRYRGQRQKWFAMRFLGRDGDIDIASAEEPEFRRWRWVEIEELPRLIVPFKRQLYLDVIEEFKPLLSTSHSAELSA